MAQWRDALLRTMPWYDKITQWWNASSTTYSERRNLIRHLMPLSLHTILSNADPPLLTKGNIALWNNSLTHMVNKLLSLKHNTPDNVYCAIVPRPASVVSSADAVQRANHKRNRALAFGFNMPHPKRNCSGGGGLGGDGRKLEDTVVA